MKRTEKKPIIHETELRKQQQSQQVLEDVQTLFENFAKGDFRIRPRHPEAFSGRYETLRQDALEMVSFLTQMTKQLQENSYQIDIGSEQIASSMQQLAASTEEQANSTAVLEEKATEIMIMIQQNAKETETIAWRCEKTGNIVTKVDDEIQNLRDVMNEVLHKVESTKDHISKIIAISKKINILALNVTIAAERTKGNGNEFSVISKQLQVLNKTTQNEVKEMQQMMQNIYIPVEHGKEMIENIVRGSKQIRQSASEIVEASQKIAIIGKQQSNAVKDINQRTNSVKDTTENNSAIAEELAATMEQMQSKINETHLLIKSIKIE